MLKAILALSLLAATSAHALPPVSVIHSADGVDTWTPLESTVRVYTNTNNVLQWDMLFQRTSKGGGAERVRFGVTGCGDDGGGQIARVNPDSTPKGTVIEWAWEGNRIFDGLAMNVCIAGARAMEKQGN